MRSFRYVCMVWWNWWAVGQGCVRYYCVVGMFFSFLHRCGIHTTMDGKHVFCPIEMIIVSQTGKHTSIVHCAQQNRWSVALQHTNAGSRGICRTNECLTFANNVGEWPLTSGDAILSALPHFVFLLALVSTMHYDIIVENVYLTKSKSSASN